MIKRLPFAAFLLTFSASAFSQNVYTQPGGYDTNSFGHSLIYLGLALPAAVIFDPACAPGSYTPPDVCFIAPANSVQTSFEYDDLGSIVIPANSTKTELWPVMILHTDIDFQDQTGNGGRAIFHGNVILTIESDALKDSSIIDAGTGLPANGKLTTVFGNVYAINRQLAPNESYSIRLRSDSSGIAAVTTHGLMDGTSANMTDKQVKKFFESKITLHWGLSGSISSVSDGLFTVGIRVMGDQ